MNKNIHIYIRGYKYMCNDVERIYPLYFQKKKFYNTKNKRSFSTTWYVNKQELMV